MLTRPLLHDWLVTSALTTSWAAFIWAFTVIVVGRVPQLDEASKLYDEQIAPATAASETSRQITVTLDSVIARASRRQDRILGVIKDTAIAFRKGLSDPEQVALSISAYHNADSATFDSVLISSMKGRPLAGEELWYIGTLEAYLGTEAEFWYSFSNTVEEKHDELSKRSSVDRLIASYHRYEAAIYGLRRNTESAAISDSVRKSNLRSLVIRYDREVATGKRVWWAASAIFVFTLGLSSVLLQHLRVSGDHRSAKADTGLQ